jgi:hypothetical protein
MQSGNAMVLVRGLELARDFEVARIAERKAELDEREKAAAEREAALEQQRKDAAWLDDWYEQASSKLATARQELEEVERARDELRALLEAEAATAGMEVIEDED